MYNCKKAGNFSPGHLLNLEAGGQIWRMRARIRSGHQSPGLGVLNEEFVGVAQDSASLHLGPENPPLSIIGTANIPRER